MANTTPKFLGQYGLSQNTQSRQAFSMLDDIISARGGTRYGGRAQREMGRGNADIQGKLAAQEALTAEQRRLKDMGLVEDLLINPALQSKAMKNQQLGQQIAKEGGDYQQQKQLYTGLSQIANNVAQAFASYEGKPADDDTGTK